MTHIEYNRDNELVFPLRLHLADLWQMNHVSLVSLLAAKAPRLPTTSGQQHLLFRPNVSCPPCRQPRLVASDSQLLLVLLVLLVSSLVCSMAVVVQASAQLPTRLAVDRGCHSYHPIKEHSSSWPLMLQAVLLVL